MVDEEYTLVYFNCRGIGEPIRYMFAIAGVPYQDIRLPFDESNKSFTELPSEWKEVVPYGKLPMLKIGNKTLVSSKPICRYLAKKFSLLADGDHSDSKCDEISDSFRDYLDTWRKIYHCSDPDLRTQLLIKQEETTRKYLQAFENQISSGNGETLVGPTPKITWADIYIVHGLDQLQSTFNIDLVSPYPALKNLIKSVLTIPAIQDWIQTRPVTIH